MVICDRHLPQALAVLDDDFALHDLRGLVVDGQGEGLRLRLAVQRGRDGVGVLALRQGLGGGKLGLGVAGKAGVRHRGVIGLLAAAVIGLALVGQRFLIDIVIALVCNGERQFIRVAQHGHSRRHMIV